MSRNREHVNVKARIASFDKEDLDQQICQISTGTEAIILFVEMGIVVSRCSLSTEMMVDCARRSA